LTEETPPMSWIDWYNNLAEPPWTPTPSTIGLIWTILYPIIVVSYGFVFVIAFRGNFPRKLAVPLARNLVANRWIALAQGPYFVWVSIATVLQLSITAMNW
jgi:translocator protein